MWWCLNLPPLCPRAPPLPVQVKELREQSAPGARTVYLSRPLSKVPYYDRKEQAEAIMASDRYKDSIGHDKLSAPEYSNAVYDIVNWAKVRRRCHPSGT